MSLASMLKGNGPSGYGYGSTAEQVTQGLDLVGQTFLVTGCNSGIGLETMRVLALRGGHVLALARTTEKAQNAIDKVSAAGTALACDLSEPSSVRQCVAAIKESGKAIDAMICNAGIMALPKLETKHGFELQFFTNHIGHFILVTELLDALSPTGRVVMVSSAAHNRAPPEGIQLDNLDGKSGYKPWAAYGQSKLANLLFARHLAKKLASAEQTANSVHPGVIHTNLTRHMNPAVRVAMTVARPLFLKSMAQGAATQCYVAAHPDAAAISGEYFADCNRARSSKHGRDDAMAEKLWQLSEDIAARLS